MNLGQVYTKQIVADFMVNLFTIGKNARVLDPCVGRGVFIDSLIDKGFTNLHAVEIDSMSYNYLVTRNISGVEIKNCDFFNYSPQLKFDGIIMNPPYVRQEEIDDLEPLGLTKEKAQKVCNNFEIYSKANLYLYFVAHSIQLLRKGGELIAIFPNAWLNTPDGKSFYSQLETKGSIDVLYQVKGYPFVGNPLVDVMILKFTKGGNLITERKIIIVEENQILFGTSNEDNNFEEENCVPLSRVAKVKRGISTGYNKMFINPQIDGVFPYVEILSSPKNVLGYNTDSVALDKLLTINEMSEHLEAYVSKFRQEILDTNEPKALADQIKAGKIWYKKKAPKAADIIFPYIVRDSIRFVYNSKKIVVRDNFYTISSDYDPLLMGALLNNYFVFSQLENTGKSYGNGLLKIQKYDVDNIVIPSPLRILDTDRTNLIHLFETLMKSSEIKYIDEISLILSQYYKMENIKEIYLNQKKNRLTYGL